MISVIVPVFNVEKYLPACIESILRQTFKDIEILLIDDGSTDESGIICEKFALDDDRIKVFHKENGGLSDARNYGIERATGAEVTFIDSDDEISFDMLERLHRLKIDFDAQISVCFRELIKEEDLSASEKFSYQDLETIYSANDTENSFRVYFESKGGGLVAWGKLYDKNLFNDIRFPVGKYNEDVFTTYRLIDKCNNIVITSARLYLYRIRHDSIMNRRFEYKHLDTIYGNIEMTKYIENKFPNLCVYPQRLLVYATLSTALKMMRAGYIYKDALHLIKTTLKQYDKIISSNVISKKAKLLSYILMYSGIKTLNFISKAYRYLNSKGI